MNKVNQFNSSKLSLRAEIDGLRSIAVISVANEQFTLKMIGNFKKLNNLNGAPTRIRTADLLITNQLLKFK